MSKTTEDLKEFAQACLNTPFRAVCVKKRDKSLQDLFEDKHGHGILVSPTVLCGAIQSQDGLNQLVAELNPPSVTVRGHGWDFETPFVWTGSAGEFNETWEVD